MNINSDATVISDANIFNVVFSTASNSSVQSQIEPSLKHATDESEIERSGFKVNNAAIAGGDLRTINNISTTFTKPG